VSDTPCRTPTGENFQYVFKGAPPARQRRTCGSDTRRRREVIDRGCVIETGTTPRPEQGVVGQLADSRAAAMSRPLGRKP
jgi:hypothetical protein